MEGNLVEHWGTLGYLREPRVNGYTLLKVCQSNLNFGSRTKGTSMTSRMSSFLNRDRDLARNQLKLTRMPKYNWIWGCQVILAPSFLLEKTRQSILVSDSMTKSDCSLNACLMLSECSESSWSLPEEVFLKSSWSLKRSSWSLPEATDVILKLSSCLLGDMGQKDTDWML